MSDQKADLERIRECSDALKRIHDAFAKKADPAAGYGKSELGSQELIDAFSDFASNWKIHRKELAGELEKLCKLTSTFADSFEQIDHKLAEALRGTDEKAKKK